MLKRTYVALACLGWLAICVLAQAQAPYYENLKPYLKNYDPEDYEAHNQNWAVVQDNRGIMYMGNNNFVLEFDGTRWKQIPLPNFLHARSLTKDRLGRIWVGGYNEIGYLKPDSTGLMKYQSIIDRLDPNDREFQD